MICLTSRRPPKRGTRKRTVAMPPAGRVAPATLRHVRPCRPTCLALASTVRTASATSRARVDPRPTASRPQGRVTQGGIPENHHEREWNMESHEVCPVGCMISDRKHVITRQHLTNNGRIGADRLVDRLIPRPPHPRSGG